MSGNNKSLLRQLYADGRLDECLQLIEACDSTNASTEQPLDDYFTFIKGTFIVVLLLINYLSYRKTEALIRRKQGNLQECLQLLQSIPSLSVNYVYLKQVAITLFLCKRYRMALEIFGEHLLKGFAQHCSEDWVYIYLYISLQMHNLSILDYPL